MHHVKSPILLSATHPLLHSAMATYQYYQSLEDHDLSHTRRWHPHRPMNRMSHTNPPNASNHAPLCQFVSPANIHQKQTKLLALHLPNHCPFHLEEDSYYHSCQTTQVSHHYPTRIQSMCFPIDSLL